MGHTTRPHRATDRRCLRALLAAALLCAALPSRGDDFLYVVRPGDNPWNVTERYLLGIAYWPKIQRLNRITDPIHIKPGTVLRIPSEWLRLVATEVRLSAWSGDVSWSAANGAPIAPSAGAVLTTGARLRTGPDASATLVFEDGSRVLVLADSELAITQAARYVAGGPMVQLQLLRGNLENLVTPHPDRPGRFEIRTPAAVAAVRGTVFRVGATNDDARSEVLVGAVDLANTAGRQGLRQGYGTRAAVDRPPLPPSPLLPAPDLAAAPAVVERLPFEAPIAPLRGAAGYRSLLAPDAGFASVVSNRVVDGPRIALADVPDGDYVVRVRAIDAQGLEGYSTDRTIRVHARPEPPVLIDPPLDAQLTAEQPTLRWTGAGAASRYHLQVSDRTSFDTLLVDTPSLDAPTLQMPTTLPPGPYFWRVASVHPAIGHGPFSDVQAFRRVLPGPGVEPPDPNGDPLALRWRDMGPGVRYRLQLAGDAAFAQPLVDTVVADPRFPLKKPASGDYVLRVASISPDGVTGPWGTAQTLTIADPAPPLWPALLLLVPFLFL